MNVESRSNRFLILVRHASRDFESDHDETNQSMMSWTTDVAASKPDFKKPGLPKTLAIANRLVDELGAIRVTHILHSPHTVAEQTAAVFRWVCKDRHAIDCSIKSLDFLDPNKTSGSVNMKQIENIDALKQLEHGSAIILVGHQPMLTSMARAVTRKLPVGTLPLGGSEAACFELKADGSGRLLWLLTEKTPQLMGELREKIKSKYDVAKFFLGAFVVNTGFVLSGEVWSVSNPVSVWMVLIGFFITLVALAFTAATLVSYDSLMMPTDFWSGSFARDKGDGIFPVPEHWSVLRPPSQAQIVLFYEMVHVWNAFFIPALVTAFLAVLVFIVALALNSLYPCTEHLGCAKPGDASLVLATCFAAALAGLMGYYYWRNKPNLGFED